MSVSERQQSFTASRAELLAPVPSGVEATPQTDDSPMARAQALISAATAQVRVVLVADHEIKRIDGWCSPRGLVLLGYRRDDQEPGAVSLHEGASAVGALTQLLRQSSDTDVADAGSYYDGRQFETTEDLLQWLTDGDDRPGSAVVVASRVAGVDRTIARVPGAWGAEDQGAIVLHAGGWATMLAELLTCLGLGPAASPDEDTSRI